MPKDQEEKKGVYILENFDTMLEGAAEVMKRDGVKSIKMLHQASTWQNPFAVSMFMLAAVIKAAGSGIVGNYSGISSEVIDRILFDVNEGITANIMALERQEKEHGAAIEEINEMLQGSSMGLVPVSGSKEEVKRQIMETVEKLKAEGAFPDVEIKGTTH